VIARLIPTLQVSNLEPRRKIELLPPTIDDRYHFSNIAKQQHESLTNWHNSRGGIAAVEYENWFIEKCVCCLHTEVVSCPSQRERLSRP
jgi:hypothetical protein